MSEEPGPRGWLGLWKPVDSAPRAMGEGHCHWIMSEGAAEDRLTLAIGWTKRQKLELVCQHAG